jgi:hypothetical protein
MNIFEFLFSAGTKSQTRKSRYTRNDRETFAQSTEAEINK